MTLRYKETHPWISFKLNIGELKPYFWFSLGECIEKCERLEKTATSITLRERLYKIYLQKGAQATTAIEGNTLSDKQVAAIIEDQSTDLPRSYSKMEIELRNVKMLYEDITHKMQKGHYEKLSPHLVCDFQRRILQDIAIDGYVGRVRQREVVVGNYRGAPANECEALLKQLCQWLNGEMTDNQTFADILLTIGRMPVCAKVASVIRAMMAHLYIAWIHPFDDGNGRTARMVEFDFLFASGIPTAAAHLLSNHCNREREEYYAQLSNASKKRSPNDFLQFMVEGFRKGLDEQLEYLYAEHEQLTWRAVAEERITGSDNARQRRQKLALDLYLHRHEGKISDLIKKPEIALLYATSKSGEQLLYQDLDYLSKEELVAKNDGRYCANRALITSLKSPVARRF